MTVRKTAEDDAYKRVYAHLMQSYRGHDPRSLVSMLRPFLAITKPTSPGAAAGRIDALTELLIQAGACDRVVSDWWQRYQQSRKGPRK